MPERTPPKLSSLPYNIDAIVPGASFNDVSSQFEDALDPVNLSSGALLGNTTLQDGYFQSSNYEEGTAGWKLTPSSVEINVSTAIASLDIPDTTTANSFHVDNEGNTWWGATTLGSALASVLKTGAATFTNVTITGGSITTTPISGIPNNSSTDIALLNYTHNLSFSVTDNNTVAWGSGTITLSNGRTFSITGSNTGNMAARTYIYLDTGVSSTALQTTTTVATAMGANKLLVAVAENGAGQATFQVYGGIGGIKVSSSQTNISNNNWTFSGTWSVTDADTIAWGSGTLKTSDGTSYSITGSNTGNMAAKTYIYFDLGTSSTAFQTTTTATTAIGDGKILVAIAQNGTGEANYIVVNDKQHNIDAANIVAGSITANEIAASTITAAKLNVSQLSAISANLGTITAGTITGNTIRTAASGTRFYMDTTTFQGINSVDDPIFRIEISGVDAGDVVMGQDGSGTYAIWDNSAGVFQVFADNVPQLSQGTFGGDGSDGALTISSGTTTLSAASASTLVKNYTSISITSTGKLAFSNPATGGTIITLKSQGNVTITSSGSPTIDLRGIGAAAATDPNGLVLATNSPKGNNTSDPDIVTTGGARYDMYNFYTTSIENLSRRYVALVPGAGGGQGAGGSEGAGGRGGGALLIECGGALNFGASATINSSGNNGSNASGAGGGGGGGGSAGTVVILYNTLTANSGTITASGGSGGNSNTPDGDTGGGAGAGSLYGAGGDGGASGGSGPGAGAGNGAGGGGGAGTTTGGVGGGSMGGLVAKNVYFA